MRLGTFWGPPSGQLEALAIGGGNAKALTQAVEAARAQVQRLNIALPRSAHSETSRANENKGMTTPEKNKGTTDDTNDNGAGVAGAPEQTAGGSPFTLPTPGGKEKTVSQLFGEIVWLFSQSPKHKNFFVSDLEWLVMTPIMLRQFRVFYAPDRPIGVALWGYVNDAVEERLKTGQARMAPADWKSGETLWLVDIVAPFGGHDAMIKDLKEKVFPERELKYLGLDDGRVTVEGI